MIAEEQVKSVVQPLPEEQQQNFDYTALDQKTGNVVRQCADQIKSLMHQTIKTNIEIGQAALILAGQCKRLVVTQAVRVEGSTYNGNKTNTGMAASKKQGKWASRTAGAMFG